MNDQHPEFAKRMRNPWFREEMRKYAAILIKAELKAARKEDRKALQAQCEQYMADRLDERLEIYERIYGEHTQTANENNNQ